MTTDSPTPDLSTFSAFPLSALDRSILTQSDSSYVPHSWTNILSLIQANRLEEFTRSPSSLRRYLHWSQATKSSYGSITNFILRERLHWTSIDANVSPPRFEVKDRRLFASEDDFKVLRNDWPYGLADGIVHLVVWLKSPIPVDEATGDVTEDSRRAIDEFLARRFAERLDGRFGEGKGREHVVWFKNWVALQSVRGVDHVHVLVRDVPDEIVNEWTK